MEIGDCKIWQVPCCSSYRHIIFHGPPKPTFLEVFMVNNLVISGGQNLYLEPWVFSGGSWLLNLQQKVRNYIDGNRALNPSIGWNAKKNRKSPCRNDPV